MIKFVRNLFKKESKEIKIKIDDISDFLKNEGYLKCTIDEDTKPFFNEIKSLITQIKQDLVDLENAKLRNPDIDPKSKQIMEGNRISYIQKIQTFINSINIPVDCDFEILENFITKYKHDVDLMNKSTIKSFYIVSEFFKDNTKNIAIKIKKIDDIIIKLDLILKEDSSNKVLKINNLLDEFNEIKSKIDSINDKIKEINLKTTSIDEELDKLVKKEIAIKSGPSYKELSELYLKKENLNESLNNEKKRFSEIFIKIEPGFKKLDYILTDDKTLKSYLDDPFHALINDKNLNLLNLLNKLKDKVSSGEIDLKDKKKENILLAIELLDLNQIKSFTKLFTDIINEINQINVKINSLSVGRNLSEIEYKKDHLEQKKKLYFEEENSLKKSLLKYDFDEIINLIKLNLESLTNSKVIFLKDDHDSKMKLEENN